MIRASSGRSPSECPADSQRGIKPRCTPVLVCNSLGLILCDRMTWCTPWRFSPCFYRPLFVCLCVLFVYVCVCSVGVVVILWSFQTIVKHFHKVVLLISVWCVVCVCVFVFPLTTSLLSNDSHASKKGRIRYILIFFGCFRLPALSSALYAQAALRLSASAASFK